MALDINKLLSRATEARADIQAKSGGGDKPVTPPMGASKWRILPGWRDNDAETFFHAFGQHFMKDTGGKIVGAFVCRGITFGEHCEYCEAIDEMRRSTKDQDQLEKINEFRAPNGYLVNALRIDGDNASTTKPVLFRLPQSLLDQYLQLMMTRAKDDELNILDPVEGRNITINREGTGKNTKYSLSDAAKSTPVDKAALEAMIDIDDYIEKEINRGRSNLLKFSPTVRALASSIGMAPPKLALSGPSASSTTATGASAKKEASKPTDIDETRIIGNDAALPWDEAQEIDAALAKETPKAEPAKAEKVEEVAKAEPAKSDEDDIDALLAGL